MPWYEDDYWSQPTWTDEGIDALTEADCRILDRLDARDIAEVE